MRNVFFCLLVGILLLDCSEENPSDVFLNSSNEESSSSVIENYSSSSNVTGSSSSETISSNNELSSSSWVPYSYGELIDERDGQVYKTIKIGEQTWMAENLNFAYSLPTSNKDSSNTTSNKQTSKDKYGKLYRWSIAMDSAAVFSLDGKGCGKGVNCGSQPSKGVRGVCPENWHIPNETDIKNIIGNYQASNDIWIEHYWFLTENEDNEFKTEMKLKYDNFWTSAQIDENNAKGLGFVNNVLTTTHSPKGLAFSIRCVKDDEKFHVEHGSMTDERDGQVYKTVTIGNQTWMAENLNYAYTKPLFKFYYETTETIDSASFCYNNEPDSCAKYGRLYMWETNMGCASEVIEDILKIDCPIDENDYSKTRGICPEKWHIPSVNEWKSLQNVVNHFITDLKSTEGWLDDGNGSDVFGFRILPTGYYIDYYEGFAFKDIGKKTCFWTLRQYTIALFDLGTPIDEYYYEDAYPICISSNTKDFSFEKEPKIYAYPVRCVKDSTEEE